MSLKTYLERIKYIDNLIKRNATGDVNSLANKLGLSRSHVLALLKEMKEYGFPIAYSKKSQSYYYYHKGKLIISFFQKEEPSYANDKSEISKEDQRRILGGSGFNKPLIKSSYIRLNYLNFE